jgi:hypothetical protein
MTTVREGNKAKFCTFPTACYMPHLYHHKKLYLKDLETVKRRQDLVGAFVRRSESSITVRFVGVLRAYRLVY